MIMFLRSKFKDKVTKLTWQRKSPHFMIQYIRSLTPNHIDAGKSELLQYFPLWTSCFNKFNAILGCQKCYKSMNAARTRRIALSILS